MTGPMLCSVWRPTTGSDEPIDELTEAARRVEQSACVEEMLETIVHTAQLSLPGVEHVGISTTDDRGKVTTRAQTGDLVTQLDDL